MKIIPRFIPIFLLIALLGGACQLEKLQDPIIITKHIEKEFYLDLQEYLHPTNRQLRFMIRTIENQECLNETIETDYFSVGRDITLSINSIVPAQDCQEGMAPAKSDVLAGKLPNGGYNFDIALRNTVVNKGQLIINDESFTIKMETQEGITLLHNNLQKIPADAFWGYVVCRESERENLQAELTDLLTGQAMPATYRSGFYGFFEINNNTSGAYNVFLSEPPAADFYFPILYQLSENVDEGRLKALLESFRQAHPDIMVKANNADGRIF